jgi:putative sterol carrier protein
MSVADDVKEIFDKMPEAFLPEKAGNTSGIIQIDLNGDGGGQWALHITNGKISITEGQADSPKLTLKMLASDYLALSHGQVNPMNLFMAGKIKLEGDMMLAMKFPEMFRMDGE